MLFIFTHNNQKVFEGVLKKHAFKISKHIQSNPGDSFSLKIVKPLKTKTKVVKEITSACDITEYCLYSLL